MKSTGTRITFGIIVLNGEPFVRYNLRSLYPFAHQIIVVEGASPAATNIATPRGHSLDSTLKTLHSFRTNEDPEGKLTIITAEDEGHPDGFWPGEKHEQSQAYAKRATGDYLWQVDIDEFYKPEQVQAILEMLDENPGITAISFPTRTFWGGLDYEVDSWYLRRGAKNFHRLFKWGPGYQYVTHRPPTVHDSQGQNLRDLNWIPGKKIARKGINLYHYSLLFPKQVTEKCEYYGKAEWVKHKELQRWAKENFLNLSHPYRVHNVYTHPSWLVRYFGAHPPQVLCMFEDIEKGHCSIKLRPTDDIENMLDSPLYGIGRAALKIFDYINRAWELGVEMLKKPYRVLLKIWC